MGNKTQTLLSSSPNYWKGKMTEIYREGNTGMEYEFSVFEKGTLLPAEPGIFCLVDVDEIPVFIGETENLSESVGSLNENLNGIDLAAHVHFHLRNADRLRSLILEDLIIRWNPRCKDAKCLNDIILRLK